MTVRSIGFAGEAVFKAEKGPSIVKPAEEGQTVMMIQGTPAIVTAPAGNLAASAGAVPGALTL